MTPQEQEFFEYRKKSIVPPPDLPILVELYSIAETNGDSVEIEVEPEDGDELEGEGEEEKEE